MKRIVGFFIFIPLFLASNCDENIFKKNKFTNKEKQQIQNGNLEGFVGSATNPIGGSSEDQCNFDDLSLSSSKQNLSLFKKLTYQHYEDKSSGCSQVLAGHINIKSGRAYTSAVNTNYMETLGRSFLKRICSKNVDGNFLKILKKKSHGGRDALGISVFKKGHPGGEDPMENVFSSYGLLYTLGHSESSGNFLQGRDVGASNYASLTKEAGVFQLSPNSLTGPDPLGAKTLLRSTMQNYIKSLDKLSDKKRAHFCGVDSLGQGGYGYDNRSNSLKGVHRYYCRGIKNINFKDFNPGKVDSGLVRIFSNCFSGLQKHCPAFAVDTAIITARTNREHNGPLLTKSEWRKRLYKAERVRDYRKARRIKTMLRKPYLRPACQSFFRDIYKNKSALCQN